MNESAFALITGLEMVAVGLAAAWCWQRFSALSQKWLWLGAALWAVAVTVKLALGLGTNQKIIGSLFAVGSVPLLLFVGGLYLGVQSSLCELGLTFAAVFRWRCLGENAPRALAIGLGSGVVEAVLLGLAALLAAAASFASLTEGSEAKHAMAFADHTALAWLLPLPERAIALLGHAGSRVLVLLGCTHRRPRMVFSGWFLFTLVDSIGGAFILAAKVPKAEPFSMWWLECVLLPFALINIPILRWCWRSWPSVPSDPTQAHLDRKLTPRTRPQSIPTPPSHP